MKWETSYPALKPKISKVTVSMYSTGVAGSSGTANTLSKIIAYTVPLGMNLLMDEDTILQMKDHGTTETPDGCQVEVRVVPATGFGYKAIAQTFYGKIKAQYSAEIRFKPTSGLIRVTPNAILQLWLNSTQTVYGAVTNSVDFDLEAKYITA
jgi:hypothetical protein